MTKNKPMNEQAQTPDDLTPEQWDEFAQVHQAYDQRLKEAAEAYNRARADADKELAQALSRIGRIAETEG